MGPPPLRSLPCTSPLCLVQVHLIKSLGKAVPDLGAVGSEGYKFVTACKAACIAFDKLMLLNPNSVLTKRVYSRFLLEVCGWASSLLSWCLLGG